MGEGALEYGTGRFHTDGMVSTSQAGPGRPREFDVDRAVRDAMDAFWTAGFHATSLPDLLRATNLSRGSLYKAFGDKRALFLAALDLYCDAGLAALAETLAAPGPAVDAIRAALMRYASLSTGATGRRGCMAVATATELAPHDPEITAQIGRHFRALEAHCWSKRSASPSAQTRRSQPTAAVVAAARISMAELRAQRVLPDCYRKPVASVERARAPADRVAKADRSTTCPRPARRRVRPAAAPCQQDAPAGAADPPDDCASTRRAAWSRSSETALRARA